MDNTEDQMDREVAELATKIKTAILDYHSDNVSVWLQSLIWNLKSASGTLIDHPVVPKEMKLETFKLILESLVEDFKLEWSGKYYEDCTIKIGVDE